MADILEEVSEVIEDHIAPIPVHIVDKHGDDVTRIEGTEYASFATFVVLGTETQPIQILAQDLRRKRAVILVNPGFSDNNTAGYLKIGDLGSVSNGQGMLLVAGNGFVMEHGRAVWLKGDGSHGFTVSIEDERYSRG